MLRLQAFQVIQHADVTVSAQLSPSHFYSIIVVNQIVYERSASVSASATKDLAMGENFLVSSLHHLFPAFADGPGCWPAFLSKCRGLTHHWRHLCKYFW